MEDKVFIKKLMDNKIRWTYDELEKAKKLKIRGLLEYVTDMYSGQYKVTERGRKFLSS